MDVIRATVALRERDLLDVLDLSVRFAAKNARALGLAAAVCMIPGLLTALAVREALGFATWVFAFGWTAIMTTPIVALASRLVFDERASTREGLALGARALPRVIGARALQLLAIAPSLPLVIVPAFALGALLHAPEVALLERAGPIKACRRSYLLATRARGSLLGALTLAALGVIAAPLGDWVLRTTMTQLFDATPPPSFWDEGASAFALVGVFAAAPLLAVARFFLYLNARTRVEGWDVQTLFVAIAQRHA